MAKTKTSAIVNAVIAMTGRGSKVFNDRLADGARSVKVWGWEGRDYQDARDMLLRAGCRAECVFFARKDPYTGKRYTRMRLRVVE